MDQYKAIMASDLPDVDKVKEAFALITGTIVQQGEQEIEALRAMHDRENLVKEQIKVSTVRLVRDIFAGAYRQATGRKPWEDADERG
ncbi:MAG: hypothetical protein R3E31_00310 [Chloroflexota bacterium]